MTNSPGPSTSTTVKTTDPDLKKKKRTRRKPRTRSKKDTDSPPDVDLLPLLPTFHIQPVGSPHATVYKLRDQSQGPINLQSLLKCSLFHTRVPSCDPNSALNLLQKISNLAVNGIREASSSKKKKGKRKERVFFPEYLSEAEVESGLETRELMKGYIRINPKNAKESYVGNEDVSKTDYMITSVLDRNRAFDGDEVVLRLKTETEDKKKTMEVVYITKKIHPRTAVGFLAPIEKNKEYALFTPRDKRIPKIKIPRISWPSGFQSKPQLYQDILFIVKITDWKDVKYAIGTITENLGLSGDLKIESLAILREFCLDPTPFGDDIRPFLPKSTKISTSDLKNREDLRKECVFTIDPITARDLDDALSCKELPNGNYEVGVHISDASFFLPENTRLDEIVKSKATTIYMVDSVYHMLPVELCFHCSLLPGEDKLAFSVFWELTPTGDIVDFRIKRSVINSCVQLAYEHAQVMIDDPDRKFERDELPEIYNGFNAHDLSKRVNDLQRIAVCLREKRRQNGSLKINQIKIGFVLDPATGEPKEFYICENKPAHRLIEEFMLLANMTVAKWINEAYPDLAFLRLHEAPKPTMMTELQKSLETLGLHIDISTSGGIQASLNKYISEDDFGKARMIVLNHLLAKPMKRARYFCAGALEEELDYSHYALSIPIYTHFTSPIRRYADIMVHRLLAASLNYREKPTWAPEEVATIAETCNRQKYHAKRAGEASSDLFLAHFVEKNQPVIENAVVVDAKERSIDVIVIRTGSVVRIYTNNFGDKVTWKSEEIKVRKSSSDEENAKKMWKIFVKFPRTVEEPEVCIVLEIFTLVRVELARKHKTNKLDAKLLRPIQLV
ncbi:DIS3-like exonuclease 2 [Tribolium castaneum]|uniref:DIS3-like exonuclease 2 n=1 Tax=Tribolium castaneum TaxID=7070 RepID=A0A139WCX3_TRICA|nr:PREDICTED: DIS3-like exonuclease 2 isoform X1 [Tribolium castaneum]KYB25799.1 DIS3-like exonuclease 2 [Tribolium castaneum]|eukprot:XP_969131.1 PREDICTED: DIS3-like exonuclease 2 isoform X1 [Tribolium castaneum]